MKQWKEKLDWERNRPFYLIMAVLLAMVVYQQFLITDLQERMMNIESSSYDDQLNDIRWEAETALSENREQEKDILQLQKHSATQNWRLMEMEWDTYRTLFILGIRRVFHTVVNHKTRSFVFQNRLSVS